MDKFLYQAYRFSIIVCRNKQNKFLCVKQKNNLGWWLPGGKVQPGETFYNAALRQCQQQTSIKISIKGIINVNYGKYGKLNCLRCFYYGEPIDQNQTPKKIPDINSQMAQYLNLQDIVKLRKQWRGNQIYQYPKYVYDRGIIYPLSVFKQNVDKIHIVI